MQVEEVIQQIGQYLEGVTTFLAVAGSLQQCRQIDAKIIVGTPGTIRDVRGSRTSGSMIMQLICLCSVFQALCRTRRASGVLQPLEPSGITILVADEADALLGSGSLGYQFTAIKRAVPSSAQVILFSATFPAHVQKYARLMAPGANVITPKGENLVPKSIKQFWMGT